MTAVFELRCRETESPEFEEISIFRERPRWERGGRIPIVYSEEYDFRILERLERKGQFNPRLRSTAFELIAKEHGLAPEMIYTPQPVTDSDLEIVHTPEYVRTLNRNPDLYPVVMGLPEMKKLDRGSICEGMLRPIRYAAGGTVLAFEVADQHGWAFNLSGGFHHAKRDQAGGLCFVADTALGITKYLRANPEGRVLVVDLDAHHGDGLASYFLEHPRVSLFDMYNREMYPYQRRGVVGLEYDFPLGADTTSAQYLEILFKELPRAFREQQPTIVLYNAGNDVLSGDRCGRMRVSKAAILERDQFVYTEAFRHGAKLVQVLSGGYAPETPRVIADSIANLRFSVLD